MKDFPKVTSVGVGSSSTNYGGSNAGGKIKGPPSTVPTFDVKRNMGGGSGGNKNKLPSGTYKA